MSYKPQAQLLKEALEKCHFVNYQWDEKIRNNNGFEEHWATFYLVGTPMATSAYSRSKRDAREDAATQALPHVVSYLRTHGYLS
jgi:dsRNA-specific ribonuclease